MSELIQWKNSSQRLPLILFGARQIGKTYILEEFGKKYFKNYVKINFENNRTLDSHFAVSLEPKNIIALLNQMYKVDIQPETTLIIFDEIQTSNSALTSLKYFAENAPEYCIAAAGSLLGVHINMNERYSFPVGKVNFLQMYPMDFEEFLWACNQKPLSDRIRDCYNENLPMDDVLHQEAMNLYHNYLIVGGMPAVISAYLEKTNFKIVQEAIYNAYVADMTKYPEKGERIKIVEAYQSLPAQLAKENKKFQYKYIKKGARASAYEYALYWLIHSGVALLCNLVNNGEIPLAFYENKAFFKMYYSDVGLFAFHTGLDINNIAVARQAMGAFTENYVAGVLKSNGFKLNYWTSGYEAEVDFVIEKDGKVIPIECKAGEHVRSRSLHVFMKKYNSEYGIRISARNFGFENGVKSVPLYAAFCIR